MGVVADVFRALADGLDQAAGRDPVDRHADEAAALLDPREEGAEQTGCRGESAGRGLTTSGVPRPTAEPGSPAPPFFRPSLLDRHEQLRVALRAQLAEKNGDDAVVVTGPVPDEETGLQLGIARAELRKFQKAYGRASATIGHLRAQVAQREHAFDVLDRVAGIRAAEYQQEIGRLNEQLAEKPYRIDTGERVLHVRPGEGVLVEAVGWKHVEAVRFREQLEERMPGVRFGVVKDVGQIQIITAAEQTVVNAGRAVAKLFGGVGAESLTPDSELSKLVDAVHALDTAEDA